MFVYHGYMQQAVTTFDESLKIIKKKDDADSDAELDPTKKDLLPSYIGIGRTWVHPNQWIPIVQNQSDAGIKKKATKDQQDYKNTLFKAFKIELLVVFECLRILGYYVLKTRLRKMKFNLKNFGVKYLIFIKIMTIHWGNIFLMILLEIKNLMI